MSYRNDQQTPSVPKNAIQAAMGMESRPLPEWLAVSVATHSTLNRDEKRIDKPTHLRRSKPENRAIRRSDSFKRKFAKTSTVNVLHYARPWGVIEVRATAPFESFEVKDEWFEGVSLHFRARAVAENPMLQDDVFHRGQFCAADLVFTDWLRLYLAQRYSGPVELCVDEGDSFLDVAVVQVIGIRGSTDWHAAGKALAAIFNPKFDAAAAALMKKVQRVHRLARG
jgi:hypothetical protein